MLSLGNIAKSQLYQQWLATYNGSSGSRDIAQAIAVDDSGNVYVTGHSSETGTSFDCTTIKYNTTGTQQWIAKYNGIGNDVDYGVAIAVDTPGNVYVTGYTFTAVSSYDYITIKYNSLGVRQWATSFNGNGNGNDQAKAIAVDRLGNVYVTGTSYGGSFVAYDAATVKYNPDGVQQWVKRYNDSANGTDGGNAIAVDSSLNVYVTGYSFGTGQSYNYETIKYNSAGTELWATKYNGPNNDIDIAIAIALDGMTDVVVTGYSRGISYDYATIKYDSGGVQQWASRYNGPASSGDVPSGLVIDKFHNTYVTGVTNNDVTGTQNNYATVKYNPAGAVQWIAGYNGPSNRNDSATSIAINDSGYIFVTGKSMGSGSGFDYATVKYDFTTGTELYSARYYGTRNTNDLSNAIALDKSGGVYVTGVVNDSAFYGDYGTLKYSPMPSAINNLSSYSGNVFQLWQNYPNPFNPKTIINYELPVSAFVKLVVYDISGKEITTLVEQQQHSGNYSREFSGNELSSGVYVYKLIVNGDVIDSKKMLLLK